ncbi:MAG TPA: hypothetical protein VGD74_11305 [Vulgatibacter sp.]
MNARLRFGLILGLVSAIGAATACGDGTSTEALTLKSFHRLKTDKDGCSYESEHGAVMGHYDVGLAAQGGGEFAVYLRLVNNLESNEDLDSGRLDTNRVKVDRVEIEFDRAAPWGFLPEKIDVPTGVVVDTAEEYFVPIGAVTQEVAALINERGDVFAKGPVRMRFKAKAFGELFDGTAAESNDLSFGIEVCRNCYGTPCPGMKVQALCSSWAQPDGWSCVEPDDPAEGA